MLPKKLHTVLVVQVNPLDPVKFTLPILGMSCVIVLQAPLNVAVSCGNGTRDVQVAVDHVVPAEQSWVDAAVNAAAPNAFIVFPPQSPVYPAAALMSQEAAPAPVMSWKSTLSTVTTAAVNVRAVPRVSDLMRRRLMAELPVIVRVPVTVWLAESVIVSVFAAVPVRVSVAKVFAQFTVCEVQLSCTSLNVFPHQFNAHVNVILITDVLALKVNPVTEFHQNQVQLIIEAQSVRVLVLELFPVKELHVTVFQFVSKFQFVCVIAHVVVHISKLSCSVQPPPTPSNVAEEAKTTPLHVIVFPVLVALYVIVPVYVLVIPAVPPERFIDP